MQTDYQQPQHASTTDEDSIRASLDRMAAAWDAGDAAAFADEFTDDASYVIYVGLAYDGRAEIEREHVPVLQKWQKGTRMSMKVQSLRLLTTDVATVVTEGGISKRRPRLDKAQTYTYVKDEEGRWRCAAFQNTKKNKLFIWMARRASN